MGTSSRSEEVVSTAPQPIRFFVRQASWPTPSPGGRVRELLMVRVADARRAIALAHELVGLDGLDLRRHNGGWEVAVDAPNTDRLVVQVLDAVRQVLVGDRTATALVQLDGREYHIRGE